jgi:hypothetical protein
LGQIKTCQQVNEFISKAKELSIEITQDETKFIKSSEIKKLEDLHIKYMGEHQGFQVFVIPSLDTMEMLNVNPTDVYALYRRILGDCENRSESNKINFCTTSQFDYFSMYIDFGELFVFHKRGEPNSPFQIGTLYDRKENFGSTLLQECRNKQNEYDEKVCPILFDIYSSLMNKYGSMLQDYYSKLKDKMDKENEENNKKSFWNIFRKKVKTKIPSIIQHKR